MWWLERGWIKGAVTKQVSTSHGHLSNSRNSGFGIAVARLGPRATSVQQRAFHVGEELEKAGELLGSGPSPRTKKQWKCLLLAPHGRSSLSFVAVPIRWPMNAGWGTSNGRWAEPSNMRLVHGVRNDSAHHKANPVSYLRWTSCSLPK